GQPIRLLDAQYAGPHRAVQLRSVDLHPGSFLPETLEPAAIQIERDAGDIARALRAQKDDCVRELFRFAEAIQRILTRREASRVLLGLACSSAASPCALRCHRLVSTQPGQIAFTSTLSSPNSAESDLVILRSALLVMPLPNMYGSGSLPAPPITLTMRP